MKGGKRFAPVIPPPNVLGPISGHMRCHVAMPLPQMAESLGTQLQLSVCLCWRRMTTVAVGSEEGAYATVPRVGGGSGHWAAGERRDRASQGTRGQGRGGSRIHPCAVLRGEPAVT